MLAYQPTNPVSDGVVPLFLFRPNARAVFPRAAGDFPSGLKPHPTPGRHGRFSVARILPLPASLSFLVAPDRQEPAVGRVGQ